MDLHPVILFLLIYIVVFSTTSEVPKFGKPISNLTVAIGREAVIACIVDNLFTYKVAWLRVDTQTILTIQSHVITKNHRISVTHSDRRSWYLHIRDVKESDRGWYMCQINTDPMKSQTGYLEIVVPPDILDYQTSSDMIVKEGSNVTLTCAASGSPTPNITWRREGGLLIAIGKDQEVSSIQGPILNIENATRSHMGPYLCIASNGYPPSVSKRIMLIVHFQPIISVKNKLVGAVIGDSVVLQCHSESFPKAHNYWTRGDTDILTYGTKFIPQVIEDTSYKILMKLTVNSVTKNDYGIYRCISRNTLGDSDGLVKLYEIIPPSTTTTSTTTTTRPTTTTTSKPKDIGTKLKTFNPQGNTSSMNRIKDNEIKTSANNGNKLKKLELLKEDKNSKIYSNGKTETVVHSNGHSKQFNINIIFVVLLSFIYLLIMNVN